MTEAIDLYDEPEFHQRSYTVDRNTGFSDAPCDCSICSDDAQDQCATCLEWLCSRHAVLCAECDENGHPRYCVECALDLQKHPAALYPPYVMVGQQWYCENCVPENS